MISAIAGARRGRREEREKAESECREKLRAARVEAEKLAEELHQLKMERLS